MMTASESAGTCPLRPRSMGSQTGGGDPTPSESSGASSLRCRSWGPQTGGRDPTVAKYSKKFKSFPAIKDTKPSTFNIQANIEKAKKWLELLTILNSMLQFQCPVGSRNDDATTTKVYEDNLDDTQPLRQGQPSQNPLQGSCLTNERTSDDAEDTSPHNCSHDEDGFGAREPKKQQQNLQKTCPNSALINERTSHTNDTSRDDYRIPITEETEPGAIPPSTQNAHGSSSVTDERTSNSETDHFSPLYSTPVVLIVVLVLLGVLYFFHVMNFH